MGKTFVQLKTYLFEKSAEKSLEAFSGSYLRSLEACGACHAIRQEGALVARLLLKTGLLLEAKPQPVDRKRLEAVRGLIKQREADTDARNWLKVPPGTTMTGMINVRQHWYIRVCKVISGAWYNQWWFYQPVYSCREALEV